MCRKLLLILFLYSACLGGILKPRRAFILTDRGNLQARGLIGCWLLNEGAGTVVRDMGAYGLTGTLEAGAAWSAGPHGPALTLDGGTGRVLLGYVTSRLGTYNKLTITFWAYLDVLEKTVFLGTRMRDEMAIGVQDGNGQFRVYPETNINDYQSAEGVVKAGQWQHWAVVFDGTLGATSRIRVFLNGAEVPNISPDTLVTEITYRAGYPWYIGYDNDWVGSYGASWMDGSMDSVAFYDRALTPSEIASLYRDPYQMFRREPVEYYVTAGGEPEPPSAYTHIMIIAGTPALIVLTALAMAWQKRPPA